MLPTPSKRSTVPGTGSRFCHLNAIHARLRVPLRVAIATSARSASLTDFESGKASANSGSRSTTFVPRRYLSTYLPRTPSEKSYSALIPRLRRLDGGFFIVASLIIRRRTSADQTDPLSTNSMDHNQQTTLAGHSNDYEALFVHSMIRVWDRDRKRIIENGARLGKPDTVLPPIRRILFSIPLESDSIHLVEFSESRNATVGAASVQPRAFQRLLPVHRVFISLILY